MRLIDELFLNPTDRSLTLLLGFLVVLLFIIYPFFDLRGIGRVLVDVFFSLVLVSGAFALPYPRWRRLMLVLALATIVTREAVHLSPSRALVLGHSALTIVFLSLAGATLLARVLVRGRVTLHHIQGAVAVYLLFGLGFASVYFFIEVVSPSSFSLPEATTGLEQGGFEGLAARFVYFSFVTLTTVGYGDILPLSPVARQFTVLEGLIGQLYPAILLARLVSLEITYRGRSD